MSVHGELTETALLLGRSRNLVAIVTRSNSVSTALPAVVLLNAGSIHRVGPNRLYVRAARSLAATGQLVCRFDFAGLGDSATGKATESAAGFEARAAQETGQVMDDLAERFGVKRFVLVGLCSGADIAYRHARVDGRVAGAVLVNGHLVSDVVLRSVYPRARARAASRRYLKKLSSPTSWRRLLAGESVGWKALTSGLERFVSRPFERLLARRSRVNPEVSTVVEVAAELAQLAARRARISLVYSDGSLAYDVYRLTLHRALRELLRSRQVELRIVRRTDHVFSSLTSQGRLLALITRGVQCAYAASG